MDVGESRSLSLFLLFPSGENRLVCGGEHESLQNSRLWLLSKRTDRGKKGGGERERELSKQRESSDQV